MAAQTLAEAHEILMKSPGWAKWSATQRKNAVAQVTKKWQATRQPYYTVDQLAGKYAYSMALLKATPELMLVFKKAVIGRWTQDKVKIELANTNWIRNHSARWTEVEQMKHRKPGEYQAKLADMKVNLSAFARSIGATLSAEEVQDLSTKALYGGWSEGQMRNVMAAYVDVGHTGGLFGEAGTSEIELRQLAAANGVEYTDEWFEKNARQAVRVGGSDEFKSRIREDAAAKYTLWADSIRKGQDVKTLAGGYLKSMERMYDMEDGSASLFDPIVKRGLLGHDAQGQPATKPLWQFEEDLRRDPRWLSTKNAGETLGQVAGGVLQDWGFVK